MITQMRGKLIDIEPGEALLEIGGITYSILVTSSVEERLRVTEQVGQETTFHVLHYLEGGVGMGSITPRLVGFLNKTDLEFFSLVITVQGLGVKKALRSLIIPVKDVARAIELEDITLLKKLPEIGVKTAKKIVVELKGKAAKFALLREAELPESLVAVGIEAEYQLEAIDILIQLQYTEQEARELVQITVAANPEIVTAEALIQEIFKRQVL